MLSKAKVLGLTAITPKDVKDLAIKNFNKNATKPPVSLTQVKIEIMRKFVGHQFLKAEVNGGFYWLKLGPMPITHTQMKTLAKEFCEKGWKHVSFNLFKGDLSVCLWDTPVVASDYPHVIDGLRLK